MHGYPFGMLMPGRHGYAALGGWASGSGIGTSLPANVTLSTRAGNQPSEYVATNSIEFSPGFESGTGDTFMAYIDATGSSGSSGSSGEGGGVYRYGFNGKENDNELKGDGSQQDYGMRIYDPRSGRFLSVDPIARSYPELTPYQFSSNRPIDGIDLDGLEYKSAANWAEKNISNYIYPFHYDLDAPPSFKNLRQPTWKEVIGKTMYCATSTALAYAQGDEKVAHYLGTNGYKSNRYGQLEFFQKGGTAHNLIKSKDYQKADRGDLIFMDNPDRAGQSMMGHVAILSSAARKKSDNKYVVNVLSTNAGASSDETRHNSFGEAIYMVEKQKDGSWMLTTKWYKDVDSDKYVEKDMKDEKLIIQGFGRVDEEKVKTKK